MEQLTPIEDFKKAIEQHDELVLLKHSLTCPISREAKGQIEEFQSFHDVPTYIIHIQDHRDVSNFVEEHFGIKHESPQVFYIKNGEVDYHASHWEITSKKVEKALQ